VSYVTEQMKRELAGHVLSPEGREAYRMGLPDGDCLFAMHIGEFAGRLVVTGDVRLGGNGYGLVSAHGYGIPWFAGRQSEGYLCEKFLDREWQWDAAVEGIRWAIERDAEDGEGWWRDHAAELEAYIADPCWRHDEPDYMDFYDHMTGLGADGCDLPGMDYPRVQAGWLCAIQQRFRELREVEQSVAALDRGMEDVRAGRGQDAKKAIRGIADGLGLEPPGPRGFSGFSGRLPGMMGEGQ